MAALPCPSTYRTATRHGTLYRWVRPELVVEVRCNDLLAVDTRDQAIRRMRLEFDGTAGWASLGPAPAVRGIVGSSSHRGWFFLVRCFFMEALRLRLVVSGRVERCTPPGSIQPCTSLKGNLSQLRADAFWRKPSGHPDEPEDTGVLRRGSQQPLFLARTPSTASWPAVSRVRSQAAP